jgi:hypothetical protein
MRDLNLYLHHRPYSPIFRSMSRQDLLENKLSSTFEEGFSQTTAYEVVHIDLLFFAY